MVKIFVSYSRADKEMCEALVASFAPMQDEGLVTLSYDGGLTPGENYFDRLEEMIETADVALFLVSPASLSSAAVEIELRYALTRFNADSTGKALRIVPVILNRCDWQETPLGVFQCMPIGAVPLSELDDPTEALRDIVVAIRNLAASLRAPQRNKRWELFDDDQVYALRQEVKKALAAMQEGVVGPSPSMEAAILLKRQEEKLRSLSEELRARLGKF